ncbi:hypothetical protein [Geodermatophilus marinus]|uniref:hypothetical protein n=1 Tax=Geodermatophilus sp. LHW52908 TaxID=2303986 RepID=UPI000E3E25EE|nr:hypothetical protein [Geodermatophilus sp. LHW52908]RFU19510.1 hypothetical protein D0Z06_21220 [Geodermatophilus sp. LHW52908]
MQVQVLVRIGVGIAAALVAGVVAGGLSRAAMAAVTVAAGHESSFSWSGTGFVLGLYAAVMLPGALAAVVTTRRVRWLLPVAGALFLVVPAVGVAGEEIGATSGFGPLQWLALALTSAAVFATIPLLPVLTVRLADRWLGRRPVCEAALVA